MADQTVSTDLDNFMLSADKTAMKTAIDLQNVNNTNDLDKPVSTAQQAALDAKLDTSEKGAANGLATLDGGGQIPIAQIPASVQGGITV
ncbi:MAG: hypothetical protein MJK13_17850, partial [Pseudomonadales bacterium]|nr:hypothetical protein [Pseudomonadales bacterium]